MDKKCKTPQIFLGRFACGGGTEKRTFRFTSRNASSYFFGTLRFADYTYMGYRKDKWRERHLSNPKALRKPTYTDKLRPRQGADVY